MLKNKKVQVAVNGVFGLGMLAVATLGTTSVRADDLTLCWAAWDPANAPVELSKDFEKQSGHNMSFEFVHFESRLHSDHCCGFVRSVCNPAVCR